MPRTLGYLTLALGFIALVIVLRQTMFEDAEQPEEPISKVAETSRQKAVPLNPFSRSANTSSQLQQAKDVAADASSASLLTNDATRAGSAHDSGLASEQNIPGEPEQTTPNKVIRVDRSVIGRPFPLSDSMIANCKRYAANDSRNCLGTMELLSRMANEPRSEPWATSMEEKLRAFVTVEPDKFMIRALECRTTICFIETASLFGPLLEVDYAFAKASGLNSHLTEFSHEKNSWGARVTITLEPFTTW